MRFPSPVSSISPTARSFALFALALAMFGLGGACEDKHIGRPCELGTMPMGGTSGSVATVSSPALECPSRICLLPGAETSNIGNTGPLCTAQLRIQRGLRGRRDRAEERPDRPPLRERLRLHVADDGRQLRLPALLRLPRLRRRSRRAASEADRLPLIDRALWTDGAG